VTVVPVPGGRLRIERSSLTGAPARDTAVARAVLERVDRGELPATLRLARPQRVVAFSGRDAASPGFGRALAAAERHGFASVLRLAGGRAAVFTPATVSFSLAEPAEVPRAGIDARFASMATRLRDALRSVGVDAHVGEVAGEYCPGAWSVNARGAVKIAGVGQRLLRNAAHTGGVLVVDDAAAIRDVLVDVQAAMDLAWDPATVGAVVDEVGSGTSLDATWQAVSDAIVAAFAADHDLEPWTVDADTLDLATRSAWRHVPSAADGGDHRLSKTVVEDGGTAAAG
jgi:octanoyl-[GcvH]:protein N-octanoyltransferase